MTSNGVNTVILRYSIEFSSFGSQLVAITSKWLKIDPYYVRQKCSKENLVFSNILFMAVIIRRSYRNVLTISTALS